MTDWKRLVEFVPHRMRQTLESVRQEHQERLVGSNATSSDLLGQVRAMLIAAGSPEALRDLAVGMTAVQLRAALALLNVPEEELVWQRAVQVLLLRPRRDLLQRSWLALVEHYPSGHLERLVRAWGQQFDWVPLEPLRLSAERCERWFRADQALPHSIMADFAADSDLPASDLDSWMGRFQISGDSGLSRAIWVDILRHGDRSTFDRLGHRVVLAKARVHPLVVQKAFGRRYLEAFKARSKWTEAVCVWIANNFQVPYAGEVQTDFWQGVDAEVRREFLIWYNERELRDYFRTVEDRQNRLGFWLQFSSSFAGAVVKRMVGADLVLFLDFGEFGVVEFPKVGHAAYVYSKGTFAHYRDLKTNWPAALKDQSSAFDRIIHQGSWELKYGPWIHSLLGYFGNR